MSDFYIILTGSQVINGTGDLLYRVKYSTLVQLDYLGVKLVNQNICILFLNSV